MTLSNTDQIYLAAMELGYKYHEKGMNIEAARAEFTREVLKK